MTAQGKRKENNEIKPLPSWFELDVTTCLFSTAPVFSQLWKFLCSFGNMIHLFRQRGKKKKKEGGGEEKAAVFLQQLLPPRASGSRCVCLVQRDWEAKVRVFGEARRGRMTALPSPLGPGEWQTDNFRLGASPKQEWKLMIQSVHTHTHTHQEKKKGNQTFTFLLLNVCSTKTSTRFQYLTLRKNTIFSHLF